MSADNGVYILATNRGRGKREYRVAHAQCIENLTDDADYPRFGRASKVVNFDWMVATFGRCTVFTDRKLAEGYAIRMLEEIEREGVCEYGIVWNVFPSVRFPRCGTKPDYLSDRPPDSEVV